MVRYVGAVVTVFGGEPLVAYSDESHDGQRQRVYAVAALLGDDADWKTATARWVERTGGQPFHASECESEFAHDPDPALHRANLRLYADLATILAESNLLGYGTALDLAAWTRALPESEPAVEFAYYKCFTDVVIRCAQAGCVSIPRRRIKFIFDRAHDRAFNAHLLYTYMVRNRRDWPSSECLADEMSSATRDSPSIQMADLLARETMKRLDNEIGPVRRPLRESMRVLTEARGRFRFEYLRPDDIARLFAGGRLWADTVGLDAGKYRAWLDAHRLPDNLSSRARFQTDYDDSL